MAAGVGAVKALSAMLTTDAGRKLLTRANKLPPAPVKEWRQIINNELPRALAVAGIDLSN
jgi:hypothetical protein